MRFSHHSALDLLAAVMALASLDASFGLAAETTGGSDDLYVNACNATGYDSACGIAHEGAVAAESGAVEVQPAESLSVGNSTEAKPAEPVSAPTPSVLVTEDDLYRHLAISLSTLSAAGDPVGVKVAQSLEEVPAPETVAPLDSPKRLPAAPAVMGLNRPIATLTLDAAASPELVANLSKLKTDVAIKDGSIERFGSWDNPVGDASMVSSDFAPLVFSWAAPALYTNPIYFQQPNVERYGHYVAVCKRDNLTQSAISAAHFFVSVPALPYMVGAAGPCECSYVLGNYRPGSCNPHQLVKPPLSLRGLVYEGAAATGLVFFLP